MTEQEAKTKWCPMSRVVHAEIDKDTTNFPADQAAFNRFANVANNHPFINKAVMCMGATCMMWRWQSGPLCEVQAVMNGEKSFTTSVEQAEKVGLKILRKLDRTGYCGLAGEP